jgi:signal transduction histidine kinase
VSDPDRIQQVVLNILSNALKFTPSGYIHILCKLVFDESKNKYLLKVTVRDTGVGISKENQTKLFKLFGTMQHSGQNNTNGIGLGLVISRSIVEAYGG